jgi:hypothetical protein
MDEGGTDGRTLSKRTNENNYIQVSFVSFFIINTKMAILLRAGKKKTTTTKTNLELRKHKYNLLLDPPDLGRRWILYFFSRTTYIDAVSDLKTVNNYWGKLGIEICSWIPPDLGGRWILYFFSRRTNYLHTCCFLLLLLLYLICFFPKSWSWGTNRFRRKGFEKWMRYTGVSNNKQRYGHW